jgi:hypothetical protein
MDADSMLVISDVTLDLGGGFLMMSSHGFAIFVDDYGIY